jgi:hypothetical protein
MNLAGLDHASSNVEAVTGVPSGPLRRRPRCTEGGWREDLCRLGELPFPTSEVRRALQCEPGSSFQNRPEGQAGSGTGVSVRFWTIVQRPLDHGPMRGRPVQPDAVGTQRLTTRRNARTALQSNSVDSRGSRECTNMRRSWCGRTRPSERSSGNSPSGNHPTSEVSGPVAAIPPTMSQI